MNQIDKLEGYCKKVLLDFSISEDCLFIDGLSYIIVTDSKMVLFDEKFNFLPSSLIKVGPDFYTDGYVYEFGGRWYTQEHDKEATLTELKYVGVAKQKLPIHSFLGIHSGIELLNGVGTYKTWIKKAKFLQIKALGICEKNTLAGVIDFQNQCKKNDIKPIIGMALSVKNEFINYDVKLYANNLQGWLNLLKFNKIINVDEKLEVDEKILIENLDGITIVLDPKTTKFENRPKIGEYYQLDTVKFESEDLDKEYVDNLERFILSDLKPVSIVDAYYNEKEDWIAREVLWGIDKKFDYRTKNQYFKNNDQYAKELILMFENGSTTWIKLFKEAVKNTNEIAKNCSFKYDTINRRLPKYKMTKWESDRFKTNEDCFIYYIKEGFKKRDIKEPQKYIDRLKMEIDVLRKGDVIDYFLITRDFIQYSHDKNIIVGIGRGSAGGSLVSYLLGIIQIDPLELDLLFERFLNEGRMGSMQDCKAFELETDSGIITLNEGTLLKIKRNQKELILNIEDLKENDTIIKYN